MALKQLTKKEAFVLDFTGFYHQAKSEYAYPVDLHTLHIRLRTGKDAAGGVTLIIFDPYNWVKNKKGEYVFDETSVGRLEMRREYSTRLYDYWFAEARVPAKRARYAFIARDKGEEFFYGCAAPLPFSADTDIHSLYAQCFTYPYILKEDIFNAPAWVKDTVWYQIFPERFANSGQPALKKGKLLPWASMKKVNNQQLYGGDLAGVTERLDYLAELGVTGIYFTPIFASPSTHKYNTEDYYSIDPAFGSDEIFKTLVDEAHKRGIKIMLDLVFNHIGSTHPFWLDVLKKGRASEYYDYFYVLKDDLTRFTPGDQPYETFAAVASMPKWNTGCPAARAYLLGVAAHWAERYGIDAYRLDVANEVSHDFWREFRKTVRAINPDIYIVGEVWERAFPWLMGDQFDTVMNYELTRCIWNFVSGRTDGSGFIEEASAYLSAYPKNLQAVMFNLLGSHDTSRILTTAGNSAERVLQAFTLLFTFAGSPCVLYGDEIGLAGEGMDDARKCMEWDENKQNQTIRAFVKKLIELRAAHRSMKAVDVEFIKSNSDCLIYLKKAGDETLAVLLNALGGAVDFNAPDSFAGRDAQDLLTGRPFRVKNTVTLEAYGVEIWRIL